jgi:diadenylate cyclase
MDQVLQRIQGLQQRLATYSPWEVALELAVIWAVVYVIVRFVQGTRAAGALKGLLLLLVAIAIVSRVVGAEGSLQRLGLLYDKFLALVAIALVVIFQPELRRALVRLGEASLLRGTPKDIRIIVQEVADAARYLSRSKFGGLIVLERQTRLTSLVEGGTKLNAELTSALLQTIFFPGSALHDLACVIKGRVVVAAGVQLPLADPQDMPDARLGSRHRAAVGLSQECDALVVVVSEETGLIRVAERGRLTSPLSDEQLREHLTARLTNTTPRAKSAGASAATTADDATLDTRRASDASQELDALSGETLAGASLAGGTLAGTSLSGTSLSGDSGAADSGGSSVAGLSGTPIGAARDDAPAPRSRTA